LASPINCLVRERPRRCGDIIVYAAAAESTSAAAEDGEKKDDAGDDVWRTKNTVSNTSSGTTGAGSESRAAMPEAIVAEAKTLTPTVAEAKTPLESSAASPSATTTAPSSTLSSAPSTAGAAGPASASASASASVLYPHLDLDFQPKLKTAEIAWCFSVSAAAVLVYAFAVAKINLAKVLAMHGRQRAFTAFALVLVFGGAPPGEMWTNFTLVLAYIVLALSCGSLHCKT